MFTGIVEAVGLVTGLGRQGGGARVELEAGPLAADLSLGDSLAVDGACLTVAGLAGSWVACDLSDETLRRTTLGALRPGVRVNLERPLRLGDRLGGHLVTGHVDAVGRILSRTPTGTGELLRIRVPRQLEPLLVSKGSVAVDGISLTVAELAPRTLGLALIPYTLRHTTLPAKRPGAAVNLEGDLIGKYVARVLGRPPGDPPPAGLSLTTLQEHGYA